MDASKASRMVIGTTKELTGKRVSAQTLRKLRITHVLDSFVGLPDFDNVVNRVAQECGHSADIIISSYWLRDTENQIRNSKETVEAENRELFRN
jgi:hypothetical protein